jgi:site-specific recombinase XerD
MLAENKKGGTIGLYMGTLQEFVSVVGDKAIADITRADVRQYLTHRRKQHNPKTDQPLSPYTINREFRALRVFFRWCKAEGYLSEAPTQGMRAPSLPKGLPKALTPDQIERLIKAARVGPYGQRNELITRFLLDTGLRLSELTSLNVSDVDLDQGTAMIREGKGSKTRIVPLGAKLRLRLYRYLRDDYQPVPGEQALILNRFGERLQPRGVQAQVIRIGKVAGVHVTPHTLRHTFATEYLRAGGDLETLRRILGHSTLAITQIYLHLLDDDLITAHKSFSPGDRY